MNSRKFYIYNIQKLAKMNVKKIGFFTFAFFLPSLFPAFAILTGAILQFFQHSIFAPAPYVFHTPPILKKSRPTHHHTHHSPHYAPLPLPNSTPIHTPLNPKTTQFRHKSQHQYIKPKTNPNPNTIKNALKLA